MPCAYILVDGLGADASAEMNVLQTDVRHGLCQQWPVSAAQPTLSRPNYATIITGVDPTTHGIMTNNNRTPLPSGHLFDHLQSHGFSSALIGYHWWQELTGRMGNRWRYYHQDHTADQAIFAHAQDFLIDPPDLLVVHPMGVDWAGHRFGAGSSQHRTAVNRMDALIAEFRNQWIACTSGQGSLVVGSDHGMGADGFHGRSTPQELTINYFVYSSQLVEPIEHQNQVAGLLSKLSTGRNIAFPLKGL